MSIVVRAAVARLDDYGLHRGISVATSTSHCTPHHPGEKGNQRDADDHDRDPEGQEQEQDTSSDDQECPQDSEAGWLVHEKSLRRQTGSWWGAPSVLALCGALRVWRALGLTTAAARPATLPRIRGSADSLTA